MADQTNDPGLISSLIATLKPKDNGSIPQKWLDAMLANSNNANAQMKALITSIDTGNKTITAQNILQINTLDSISKAIGPSFKQTMIDSFKAYDKDIKNSDAVKEEDKKYDARKKQKDKEEDDRSKKLATDLSKQLSENVTTTSSKGTTADLEGGAAAAAALAEVEVQPVSIASISSEAVETIKKIFSTSIGNTKTETAKQTGADAGVGNNIIAALGKGLGAGIGALGEGVGKGIAGLGKGLKIFLTSLGEGLTGVAPGLEAIAVVAETGAIGIGVLVLAVIGLATALRIATPAIQAVVPVFIALAKVIGDVLITALKQLAPILQTVFSFFTKLAEIAGSVFSKLITAFGNIVTAYTESTVKLAEITLATFKVIGGIIDKIGAAIALPIKTIGQAIGDVIEKVANSVSTLSSISGERLLSTAAGITAIAGAMALFGGGSLISGIGNFFGNLLGGGSKQNSPVDQLIALGQQTSNIDNLSNSINRLKDAMSTFGDLKTNFDPFSKFIESVNSVNMLKLAAVAAALHFGVPAAAALPGIQGPASVANNIPGTTVSAALASTTIASTEAAKLGNIAITPEYKEAMMETPLYKIQETQVKLAQTMVKKMDELIASLEPMVVASTQNSAVSNSTNNTTTSILNTSTANILGKGGDSTDRDIPYIERSKYRNSMLYARGLL